MIENCRFLVQNVIFDQIRPTKGWIRPTLGQIRLSNLVEFEFRDQIRPQIQISNFWSNSELFSFEFEIRPSLVSCMLS